jgi:hypothetical protein
MSIYGKNVPEKEPVKRKKSRKKRRDLVTPKQYGVYRKRGEEITKIK